MGVDPRLESALAHHRAGQWDVADVLYQSLITDLPSDSPTVADALNLRGVLAHRRGDNRIAIDLIRDAISRRPRVADFHNNLGEALRAHGDLATAREHYCLALSLDPTLAHAHNNLGLVDLASDRAQDACRHFVTALAIDPDLTNAYGNLANAYERTGQPDKVLETLRRLAGLVPNNAALWARIGLLAQRQGDSAGATNAYERALALDDSLHEARNNLAVALVREGAYDRALDHCRAAAAAGHDSPALHNNLAMALHRLGRLSEAEAAYRRALDGAPDNAEMLNNFANLRVEQGAVAEALTLYETALDHDPNSHGAYVSLLARAGLVGDWVRQATYLPQLPARLRQIARRPSDAVSLLPLTFSLPYFCSDNDLIHDVVGQVGRYYAAGAKPVVRAPAAPDANRRLKIGYLSPDFGDHPISHVTLPIYGGHDRAGFEVFCYSTLDRSGAGGHYLDAIRNGADHFIDVSTLDFRATAERIAADRIDILVDLTGYMRHSRPHVLAMRPAPVQAYWQGHAGGLGAPYVDYVIGDAVIMPVAEDHLYTEAIARLPEAFSTAEPAAIADGPVSRQAHGLPDGAVVFCAFNNPLKIEPECFAAWMRILAAVPDGVLWLSRSKARAVRRNLRDAAGAAGIDPARLIFAPRLPDKARHLARHKLADLFLDTFKYNASTTALDALWVGLPTLTRKGNNACSRLCASYLNAIDMPDLICDTTDAFIERAVALARDGPLRTSLKTRLHRNRTTAPLFDSDRFVRHLERAFRMMWTRHVGGQPPRSFDVPRLARRS